jgi:hypothetical protein
MNIHVPIIIICYNNHRYVENTLVQISKINIDYYKDIIILNNASTCIDTIEYLKNVKVTVYNNPRNLGPWITWDNNNHIYNVLPDKFILTDPDLKLNKNIPSNFVEILATLSDKYKTTKIGFALDISDHDKFHTTTSYMANLTICEWEKQFWENRIEDAEYELYNADIDTTFCLINKNNILNGNDLKIRVAGDFTAKHIPWYIDNEVYNIYDNYCACINTTHISTISRIVKPYVEENYLRIYKNSELFLIKNSETSLFWRYTYGSWENEMFEVFDKYLSKDKVFIDLCYAATERPDVAEATTMYASRKSKHVYVVNEDNGASGSASVFSDIPTSKLKENCANNYTLINKNNKDEELESIIKTYDINTADISLIKVDIKGREENILGYLYDIHIKFGVHLYIRVYYNEWNDKNLDRFTFLSSIHKQTIKAAVAADAAALIVF